MSPEIKVSNCCGDRLVTINDPEGTGHYECFACKKPCDGVQDCADCFPHNYPCSQGKTVPLCEKHAKTYYPKEEHRIKVPDTTPKWCEKDQHCWVTGKKKTFNDHYDCEECCECGIRFQSLLADDLKPKKKPVDFPVFIGAKKSNYSKKPNNSLATLIGSLILNCGNLYNEKGKDITVEVAKFINQTLK